MFLPLDPEISEFVATRVSHSQLLPESDGAERKHPDGSVAPDLVSLAQRNARSEEKKSLDHELSENQ